MPWQFYILSFIFFPFTFSFYFPATVKYLVYNACEFFGGKKPNYACLPFSSLGTLTINVLFDLIKEKD